ncbi:MAG TPA: DUF3372 domain-containing protein [Aeromonadales bacterium]|nr:DUF3372 domain-containing protein [Aeromonadales bacterium]
MFSYSKILKVMALLVLAFVNSSCQDSASPGVDLLTCDLPQIPNTAGTACIDPPPLQCPAPLVPNADNNACVAGADPNAPPPSVKPGPNQAILFYNRANKGAANDPADTSYDRWKLHTWNDDKCNSYAQDSLAASWGNGVVHTGIDPNYGAYWILNLKDGYTDCANFIIHDIDEKEMGGADFQMNLVQDDPDFVRMNWTISGFAGVFEFPILKLGAVIQDFAAHWIDTNTLIWNVDPTSFATAKLHYSATADLTLDATTGVSGSSIDLTQTTLTPEQEALVPLQKTWTAFTGTWTADEAKAILKGQIVVATSDDAGLPVSATHVQADKVLDDLYTKGTADADEATLGITYNGTDVTASLWAPTAQDVKLKVYDAAKVLVSTEQMVEDPATGIWSFTGSVLDRQFYRYELTVYHPKTDKIETTEATDPYSVSLSTNGDYSQFVNLDDADLKPTGWDTQVVPTVANPEDAVIYEGHIRNFSARDQSTTDVNRGKFMAFTETTSEPVKHLQELVASGLNYFKLLPANDIASINEDASTIVDLTDTVADLCAVNSSAPVCGVESDTATLQSVMESYAPYSEDAQALVNAMRGYDSYNWGYDPEHFNVPDGIYSSNPDGVARILEMRSMVKALHDMGLRVSMDMVYNHTNSAGLFDNSVFDKVVPGYYHRRDPITGNVQQTTCCNDTALENRMMDKFMEDSLLLWSGQYSIDSYRFDIMSAGSKAQMLAAREAVRTVDADTFFYGEGWDRGDLGFENATQINMAGSEIATFNDRLRDAVRNVALFSGDGSDGNMSQQDTVRLGMAGTQADFILKDFKGVASAGSSFSQSAYGKDPADIINYVSNHDNETLWDKLQFGLGIGVSAADRVRIDIVASSIPLMSQGIPYLQMGQELLRSKSMDQNSFDSGDWFNFVDFTKMTNNWNVGLPLAQDNQSRWSDIVSRSSNPNTMTNATDINFSDAVFKEFLQIRNSSSLFRLTTSADISARVGFHNIGKNQKQGLIVMSIDDGTGLTDLDPANDAIVVVVNGTSSEQSQTVLTASGFQLSAIQAASVDSTVQGASFTEGTGEGTFTVPAFTTAVFVKPQGASQGAGLSAFATSGAPDVVPYGSTTIFVRGEMNGWGEADPMDYKGGGIYRVSIPLTGGTSYAFKVASSDWSTVDLGTAAGDEVVSENVVKNLVSGGANISFTPGIDATYVFEVNAFDTAAPTLKVFNEEPFPGTTVFIRGDMNGWGENDPMTYEGGGIYKVNLTLTAADYAFKVASSDWATVNMGANSPSNTTVNLAEPYALLAGSNDNLGITIPADDEYSFIFDGSFIDSPKLSVWTTKMFGATPVFLRGDMNGWGETDTMTYQGNSVYSVDIALTIGTYNFKVASSDWATINLGAQGPDAVDKTVSLDSGYILVAGSNDNMAIDITTDGTYTFEVTGPDPTAPTLKVISPP